MRFPLFPDIHPYFPFAIFIDDVRWWSNVIHDNGFCVRLHFPSFSYWSMCKFDFPWIPFNLFPYHCIILWCHLISCFIFLRYIFGFETKKHVTRKCQMVHSWCEMSRAAFVSFGGLLMRLQGDPGNLHGFEVDKNVYLLMKKLAF